MLIVKYNPKITWSSRSHAGVLGDKVDGPLRLLTHFLGILLLLMHCMLYNICLSILSMYIHCIYFALLYTLLGHPPPDPLNAYTIDI